MFAFCTNKLSSRTIFTELGRSEEGSAWSNTERSYLKHGWIEWEDARLKTMKMQHLWVLERRLRVVGLVSDQDQLLGDIDCANRERQICFARRQPLIHWASRSPWIRTKGEFPPAPEGPAALHVLAVKSRIAIFLYQILTQAETADEGTKDPKLPTVSDAATGYSCWLPDRHAESSGFPA